VRRVVLLLSPAYLLFSTAALGDQVLIKNGDRLSGTILQSDGKILVLHTEYAGDLSLHWEQVQSVESEKDMHVEFKDGRSSVGAVTTRDGQLQVATKSGGTVVSPISDVTGLREETAYEKTLHPGMLEDWKTGLNAGFALTRGNSQTKNISLAFSATRQTFHDKLNAYANSVYASNDARGAIPSTTANTAGGGLRYDHDLLQKLFAFGTVDFFSDALQGLNLRSVFGGGLGYHVIKSESTTLDLLAGADYTRESYTTLHRNLAAVILGEELTRKINHSTSLSQRLNFYPDLNHAGNFRGTFDLGTVTKLNKWLGWQNSFSDIYVTDPPRGKKQNDVIFTTGLNVSFGQ
jgi:putative salt-induced outer membrane protein